MQINTPKTSIELQFELIYDFYVYIGILMNSAWATKKQLYIAFNKEKHYAKLYIQYKYCTLTFSLISE